jgi:predicted phosphodiesterase
MMGPAVATFGSRSEVGSGGDVVKRKNTVGIAVLVVALVAVPSLAAGGFHFAVLSDRTGGHIEGVYPRVIEEIARLNPDFVVTVGDHIEGYGDDMTLANAQWDTIIAFFERLECPVYVTPGNHDIWSDDSEEVWRERVGVEPYYSFEHEGTHFAVLDNSRLESWSDAEAGQLEWLRADLEQADGSDNVFVFAHKPLWTQTLALGESDPLHDILAAHNVDVHFTGHVHHYFSAEYDGVSYISMGSSGGDMGVSASSEPRGQFFQFGWVTVDEDRYEVAVVELGGVHGPDVSTLSVQEEIGRAEGEYIRAEPIVLEGADEVDGEIIVVVENHTPRVIEDAVAWTVPDGWTIEPQSVPVSVPPGDTTKVVFRGTSHGSLFPAPAYVVRYPLSDGREIRATGAPRIVRVAEAAELERAPELDGSVDERCWSGVGAERAFYSEDGRPGVQGETEFRFAFDSENLYIAAVCLDPGIENLSSGTADRDGPVYGEDCVGFFIQPRTDEMVVYQVYANPSGTIFDQRITFNEVMWYTTDIDWNGSIDVATQVDADRWTVEMRIPLAELGLDGPPAGPVGLNFRRKQADGWPPADWSVPIDYDPRTFGQLRFVRG